MGPTNQSEIALPELGVAIIGAGFAGLGMGARLKQAGLNDLVIFERHAEAD